MAVYTEVTDDALTAFLTDYDIGSVSCLPRHRRGCGEQQLLAAHVGHRVDFSS